MFTKGDFRASPPTVSSKSTPSKPAILLSLLKFASFNNTAELLFEPKRSSNDGSCFTCSCRGTGSMKLSVSGFNRFSCPSNRSSFEVFESESIYCTISEKRFKDDMLKCTMQSKLQHSFHYNIYHSNPHV